MSESRLVTVIYPKFRFLPESRITAMFTPVSANRYRQDEGFLCAPTSYADILEVEQTSRKDEVVFRRRVHRGAQRRSCFVINHDLPRNPGFHDLTRKIEEAGGFSAVDFKGLFVVFLPRNCDLDVGRELDKILGISIWRRRFLNWKARLRWRFKKANESMLGPR